MNNSIPQIPVPQNEPVLNYLSKDPETLRLKEQLARTSSSQIDIPAIIDGKEVRTGRTKPLTLPHNHRHQIGQYHEINEEHVQSAIQGALRAKAEWASLPYSERASVFLKAAELLRTKYRPILNAATMLGQSKTCYQAEIDSACELIDFLKFNCHFLEKLYSDQPSSAVGMWNRLDYRSLEGFVLAVSPFNFTAIGGNLVSSPALMGNVVLWKPASTAVYSSYCIMKLFEEAGLPAGVIQFLPGSGKLVGDVALNSPDLAAIHFTGSTGVFQGMWKTVGQNIQRYRTYPRLVGETGGKNFVFVHPSADLSAVTAGLIRGAYEYQGQKCSAASRAYVPKSLWPRLKDQLISEIATITMGDVTDFRNFMSAVIDRASFDNIMGYLNDARKSPDAKILTGGHGTDEAGYFIEPTLIETTNPRFRTLCEEIFGPVLTVSIYDDNSYEETLRLCDQTSPYALTGSLFARDRKAIQTALKALEHSAGNFYVNNKPTGAVVGQQPFGGARASGTNDKAGSFLNLIRWVSVRTISETFAPPQSYRYPFMDL